MPVLAPLPHRIGALCCRCHSESSQASTRSWPSAGIVMSSCDVPRLPSRGYTRPSSRRSSHPASMFWSSLRGLFALQSPSPRMLSTWCRSSCKSPELCENHDGPGALLLTPRLDAQTSFAKLFADLGTEEDVRRADLATLLAPGAPSPTQVTVRHVQALRFDLRAAHTAVVLFGSSKFLGRDELGHSRTTVGLARSRGVTVVAGCPDPHGLIGMIQTIYSCN